MLLKPAPRTYSLQDYVEELTRRIYLMTEADPELRVKAAEILTSHVGGGRESGSGAKPEGRGSDTADEAAANHAAIPLIETHPHVGGGRESGERAVPRDAKNAETASIAANPAAIPLAQGEGEWRNRNAGVSPTSINEPVAQDSPRGEPCGAKAPCGHPLTEDSRRLGKCWFCETPLERGGERA